VLDDDYPDEPEDETPEDWAEHLREDPNAKVALQALLDGGASLAELHHRTGMIWVARVRMPASKLDYEEISRCAKFLEGKLSVVGMYQLGDRFLGKRATAIRELPDLLRYLAHRAEIFKKFAGKRPALEPAIARAELVAYVKTATGQYYDEEVAALISLTLDCELSGRALAAWRGRPLHKQFIAKAMTKVGTGRKASKG
jgi:hypothetical protein